ncbi:unnamed protein product [Thelazia callipaeda]|uniref:Reverse transcriptase domain-containing protein n=1 Tax=Thelazia callipaeda TaxID=103827 RepID=A0A0N5D165_THECL|nr:unnamed protein product [Thelazia callipaeda]
MLTLGTTNIWMNSLQISHLKPNWESSLPSRKAAGPDGVYKFLIRQCTSLHPHLYKITNRTAQIGRSRTFGSTKGRYLIPKGSDCRPITCVLNLYKLATKCWTSQRFSEIVGQEVNLAKLGASRECADAVLLGGAQYLGIMKIELVYLPTKAMIKHISVDSAQENARKHLIRSAPRILRGRTTKTSTRELSAKRVQQEFY